MTDTTLLHEILMQHLRNALMKTTDVLHGKHGKLTDSTRAALQEIDRSLSAARLALRKSGGPSAGDLRADEERKP